MACNVTISGRALPCKDSLGGIKQVWIAPFALSGVGQTFDAVSAGTIADSTAAMTFKNYDMHKLCPDVCSDFEREQRLTKHFACQWCPSVRDETITAAK